MNQQPLFRLLLRPSFMSGSLVLLTTLGILGYTAWLYISDSQMLYDNLFGSYGLQDFISQNSGGFMSWQKVLLASPIAYYMLVGGVAIAAGMAVFTVLQVVGSLFRNTTSFMHEAVGGRSGRLALWGELFARLWLRVLALVGWAFYAAAFVSMLLPFAILLNNTGVESVHQNDMSGIAVCAAALLLLLLSFHLHVIFARASMLRPRLFGGDAEIAAAEAH
ncbi:MAG: hypothetical protein ABIR37_01810 [Candidatus Saccharimonadales bacterium]